MILFTGGMCIPACTGADTLPLADTPPTHHHPRHPRSEPPPPAATAADATHPTGMHSCLINIFVEHLKCRKLINIYPMTLGNIRNHSLLQPKKINNTALII